MSEITMEMARCDDVLERMVPSDVRQLIGRAERAEALVKAIESAWQDAELRAEKAEARVRELEKQNGSLQRMQKETPIY